MLAQPPPRGPRRTRFGLWLAVSLVVLNALVLGIAALALLRSRESYLRQSRTTVRNLAVILEQNLDGTLRLIDLALQDALADERLSPTRLPKEPHPNQLLKARRDRIPVVAALRMSDANGQLVADSDPNPEGYQWMTDRSYFLEPKQHPQKGLFISSPLLSRREGVWVLILSRPRLDDAGRFAGVAYGVLRLDAFTRSLGIVDVGRHGVIGVSDGDFRLVTRFPDLDPRRIAIGDYFLSPQYRTRAAAGEHAFEYEATSGYDGTFRHYAVRRVGTHPMWLQVGLGRVDALAPWHSEIWKAAITLFGSLLLSGALGLLLLRGWHRQLAMQAELGIEKEKFQSLTEHTNDVIWSASADDRFTYVSPSVMRQRGFTPEELMAMTQEQTLAISDPQAFLEELRDVLKTCAPGDQPFQGGIEVEHRRKDGSSFPAEVHITVVWGPKGEFLGLRGITRDISERRRNQEAMEGLIQDLTMALAEVKALRGLLPICSGCKKVRDDSGYWNQIETYISHYTDATFTHGYCPECMRKYFPDYEPESPKGGNPETT